MTDLVKDVEKAKLASGKSEYLRFLKGDRISMGQAVKAKCFDCCAYYEDGKYDCEIKGCPLYPWMPYRTEKGPKKEMTEAQKSALAAARKTRRIKHTGEESYTPDALQITDEKNESAKSDGGDPRV